MARLDWEYVPIEEIDLAGSLVVVGMPSMGMVGSIAANVLVSQLAMRLVGAWQSDDLPPVASVGDGIAASPVQVWATELVCGIDGKCDRLVVVKSDLPIAVEVMAPLATALAAWAV